MGLDTYAVYSKTKTLNWAGIELCGGMLSGNGSGSFRGKVYDDFIEAVTGESLYQESIPNKTVKKMADKLDTYVKNHNGNTSRKWCSEVILIWPPKWYEVKSLAQWFKVAANGGATVNGWW